LPVVPREDLHDNEEDKGEDKVEDVEAGQHLPITDLKPKKNIRLSLYYQGLKIYYFSKDRGTLLRPKLGSAATIRCGSDSELDVQVKV
jgi:hypothetical protein